MTAEGLDIHNLNMTGGVSMTLMANRTDPHSIPSVLVTYTFQTYQDLIESDVACTVKPDGTRLHGGVK